MANSRIVIPGRGGVATWTCAQTVTDKLNDMVEEFMQRAVPDMVRG